jgi:pimeloyl-ACP methyl ester carboxylesterase
MAMGRGNHAMATITTTSGSTLTYSPFSRAEMRRRDEPIDTVVLIHGMWLTSLSWEEWMEHYTARGFRVLARSWPGLEGDIEQLRRDPSAITRLGVREVAAHYQAIIQKLSKPPIIIGHSFGGLITQILLDRGLGAAGVAIASAPLEGIASLPLPAQSAHAHGALPLTLEQFHEAFANHLSEEQSSEIYLRYAVPGPDRSQFESAFVQVEPVDVRNHARAPLLLIAGARDRMSPPAMVKANAGAYRRSNAVTEFKEFPGRTHFLIGQPGWREIADCALDWAVQMSPAAPCRLHGAG